MNLISFNKEINLNNISMKNIDIYNDKKKNKDIMETYNDYELNSLSYEKALKIDKRTFFKYYKSLLKTKHPIFFSFFPINDYNPRLIKISIFLILFALIYVVNALFFNESSIHKIYQDEGIYYLSFFIPKILFSFFISHFLYTLIKYIFLCERNIVNFKNNSKEKFGKIKSLLSFKYISYFILCFLFFVLFWYYLSSFCAVFKNSQMQLIINTLLGYVFSLFIPFLIAFITGYFRFYGLKSAQIDEENKDNGKCCYKFSGCYEIIDKICDIIKDCFC
jgi:hypothetical protein